jgi:hypothetical protein
VSVPLARPTYGINHVIAYGQSLASGWEGWPALSTVPRHDSLMLGRSVRPRHEDRPGWEPVGEAAFHPLAATVQERESGALLSPAQTAGLPPRTAALGETVLEAAVNHWRARMLEAEPAAAAHPLLAGTCGVGGRGLAALSKGARPELFHRLRECAALARDTAARDGRSYGIVALLFLQGEQDVPGPDGKGGDRAGYRALLRRWHADVLEDVVAGIAGQAPPPALFLYQTGGTYALDDHAVAMAQLDVALSDPGCFMVGPSYPMPDKGGHLDPNGYRWLGAQFGKVMHRVLTLGEAWEPLHPMAVRREGEVVRLRFHVPVPPLAWGRPFRHRMLATPRDRGFTLVDEAGLVPIAGVALEGPDTVAIAMDRPPGPGLRVRYADHTRHHGLGALHDSDPTLSDETYEFDALAGHDEAADVPGWPGRRFPLVNWCVAFNVPVPG